jgi:hypothetical protein
MADTTSRDLDQDLLLLRRVDVDLFDGPWRSGLLDDDGAALLWDFWCHCGDSISQYEVVVTVVTAIGEVGYRAIVGGWAIFFFIPSLNPQLFPATPSLLNSSTSFHYDLMPFAVVDPELNRCHWPATISTPTPILLASQRSQKICRPLPSVFRKRQFVLLAHRPGLCDNSIENLVTA